VRQVFCLAAEDHAASETDVQAERFFYSRPRTRHQALERWLTGTFSAVNGTSINGSEHFVIVYNPTNVTLQSGGGRFVITEYHRVHIHSPW
jgi:hypothetical protein